jgi:hypothetical protein
MSANRRIVEAAGTADFLQIEMAPELILVLLTPREAPLLPLCRCLHDGKSGKQIERCVIPSFRIAQNMGFQGDFSPMCICCGLEISFRSC